ncbi:hypothetical protein ACHQM5_002381 [Ranunculus cassubicifolius]
MTTRMAPAVGANLLGQHSTDRNQDATIYVGNLSPQLFAQVGVINNIYVPKDRVTNLPQGYAFVEFNREQDADYAIKVLPMIKLYGQPIRINMASQSGKPVDVGANLFVGNLDPDVDEKLLHDTFSAFGLIVSNPKVARNPETGNSQGFGFLSFDCFEASDAAIATMNNQFLCNRQITVSYAYRKDTNGRERHGTQAERALAAAGSRSDLHNNRPHTLFAIPTAGQANCVHPPTSAPPQTNGVFPPPVQNSCAPWAGHPPTSHMIAQNAIQASPLQQLRFPPNAHPQMAVSCVPRPVHPSLGVASPQQQPMQPPQQLVGRSLHPLQIIV